MSIGGEKERERGMCAGFLQKMLRKNAVKTAFPWGEKNTHRKTGACLRIVWGQLPEVSFHRVKPRISAPPSIWTGVMDSPSTSTEISTATSGST